ncbi:MAG: hypothetical protein LBV16_08595 [Elusimicrobiota bacterium]|jgi:predicted RNase H-like HicB family nuclease|nr:hypothetical protein [Elusimicrobiota bacterium]
MKKEYIMDTKIVLQNETILTASVPVYFFKFKGDDYIYAECPALGINTDGLTLSEAKRMFGEALSLWIDYTRRKNNIKKVLLELGWKITKTAVIPKEYEYKVPMELLASKTQNIQVPISMLN